MTNVINCNGGHIITSLNDIDCDKINSESVKKDYIDWCKADRKKWLKEGLNAIYERLYLPIRKARWDALSDAEKYNDKGEPKPFGIDMNSIKSHATYRILIERVKQYNSKDDFIERYGNDIYNHIFYKDGKANYRWEYIEELISKGLFQ